MAEENCELCGSQPFRYTCPKCNLRYCSVVCYKSPSHLQCSEEFYKSCIQDELSAAGTQSPDEMKRIYEILKRIRATDAGIENESFADELDSDDDDNGNVDVGEEAHDEFEEGDEMDIATRLQGINLNDPEEVWNHLSISEREEFQKMVECGEIMKLVPNFKPWWIKSKASKIVEINADEDKKETPVPEIYDNIPKFSDICKKSPSPCVHYNLWNLLTAYSCIVRFFNGEHLSTASEAVAHMINLCTTLKYGTNFEDTEDAILSVETEALTTGNSAFFGDLYVESREQLKDDARQLMSTNRYKLIALSDILQLFKLAKKQINTLKNEQAEFQKLFAMCNASVELDRTKLNQFTKRIVFFLAYVNREIGEQS